MIWTFWNNYLLISIFVIHHSTCDDVVLPIVETFANIKGKTREFCPRCDCVYESRNLEIIKVCLIFNYNFIYDITSVLFNPIQVVVIIVIWVVSLLMIYMLFLMCLDPLLNKRIKNTAYQEHTNEDVSLYRCFYILLMPSNEQWKI